MVTQIATVIFERKNIIFRSREIEVDETVSSRLTNVDTLIELKANNNDNK